MFDKYSLGLTKSKEGVNGVLSRVGIGPLDFWEPGFSLLWEYSRVRVIVTLGDDHVTFVVTFDNTMRMLHNNTRASARFGVSLFCRKCLSIHQKR